MDEITCDLSAGQPGMPSLHRRRQLIAQSPRVQVQFFKLVDDIADIYFMGTNGSLYWQAPVAAAPQRHSLRRSVRICP